MSKWKADLDEELKNSSELKDIEDVNSLAKSYISMSKAYSSRVDGVTGEEDWDEFATKTGKFLRIPEKKSDYKLDDVKDNVDELVDLGHKYKLHPKQVKHFSEDFLKVLKKNDENLRSEKVKASEKELEDTFKDIKDRDECIGKALNKSGYSLDSMKKSLGDSYLNSKLQKILYDYGKSLSSDSTSKVDKEPPITTGDKDGVETKKSVTEKFEWLKQQHILGAKSPVVDTSSPKHLEFKKKFNEYRDAVGKYADENELDVSFY